MLSLFVQSSLHAQDSVKYVSHGLSNSRFTEEKPLVYVDSWDLWPYAFMNEQGEPDGYNVDLVRRLMSELNIPYTIKLKERQKALQDLKEGTAHLTMGMEANFHDSFGYYGKSSIQLFTHSVLTPFSQPVTIHNLQDLATQKVIVHERSYSHHLMNDKGWSQNAIPFNDMKEAVQMVSKEEEGQILWNTLSLKWLLRMYHITNLQLTPVDMPHGEYKFIAGDTLLLARLDKAYAKIRANDGLEDLQTKWFYPERTESGIPSWVWYIANIGVCLAIILCLLFVVYKIRERRMKALTSRRTSRLSQILQICHVRIWTYDVETQTFTWMNRNGQPLREYNSLDFARRYQYKDYERLYDGIQQIVNQQKKTVTLELTDHDDDEEAEKERTYRVVLSILRCKEGKPAVIIGTRIDITDELAKQQDTKKQLMRYQSVFNTTTVDMSYYDEHGYLKNMNERAQQTFHLTLEEAVKKKIDIWDTIGIEGQEALEPRYMTRTGIIDGKLLYYECQQQPVYSNNGELLCIYSTGRSVNEVVHTYHQIKESIEKLQKANKEVTDYIKNINFVLGVGGVRLVEYSPDTHTLTIFKGLNIVQLTLTQSRCMSLVDEHSKKLAMKSFNNMDNRKDKPVDLEVKTPIHRNGMPLILQFHFIPAYDDQGNVHSYFGMCRDTSELKNTDALLEKETARAQEVESLKNSFLRNMSYEIRTPLNAVVGFAELFEHEHNQEDEPLFIQEIKDNSKRLLNLINDILFLSRLDAHMIELNKQPTDFSQTFEAYCHMGWANYQKEGVIYKVENHYDQLVVDIDDTNMGRIIEQVTANAAQHTLKGMVRARYDYIGDKLLIAIEDTGIGMSKKTLSQAYERFATNGTSGTGLGLPICKELAEQLGGSIDISSEKGKGTTVWITMPCQATSIVRKKDI